jgi:hypothetical protein
MLKRKTRTGPTAVANRSPRTIVAAAAIAGLALAWLGVPRAGAAVTTVYSDLTPDASGTFQAIGSATTVGQGTYTQLIADDITPIAGHTGETVSSVEFYLYNGGTTSVTFDTELRFYDNSGTGGASGFFTGSAPGNLLFSYDLNPITLAPGNVQPYIVPLPATGDTFALPSGTFWAGIALDDGDGTTGATADELNQVGPVYSNPVSVGTSQDEFYQSDDEGTFLDNDPVGGLYNNGGDPVANFGFEFVTTSAVPEPASAGLIGFAAAAGLMRRRRHRVQV